MAGGLASNLAFTTALLAFAMAQSLKVVTHRHVTLRAVCCCFAAAVVHKSRAWSDVTASLQAQRREVGLETAGCVGGDALVALGTGASAKGVRSP